ncbi:MAG TPA: hypothetical protein VMH39_16420, partial [Gemmatimonadaceae bacterium]|nr:hypothetical protein [Gemmatimonadaceae bacterium]
MKLPSRLGVIHTSLALFAIALLMQAARVQLVHGSEWRAKAEGQQYLPERTPAPRGPILDETGTVLAQDIAMVQLSVAPREVRDREGLRRALVAAR